MSLDEFAVTLDELRSAINNFISKRCEKNGDHLVHKDCGGGIRKGFLDLFYLNADHSLDPGGDGFGIGPHPVPYCERCFPPDGFRHTYAVRFPILRERKERQKDYRFVWGKRALTAGDQRLLE